MTIFGTVGRSGPLVATAHATSLAESELVSTLDDNTAALTIAPAAVEPKAQGPPVVRISLARIARLGTVTRLNAAFSVDEPAKLTIAVADDYGKRLELLAKSRVGALATARPQPRLVYNLVSPGTVELALRVRPARGRSCRLTVVAVSGDGQSTRLVIPFRP